MTVDHYNDLGQLAEEDVNPYHDSTEQPEVTTYQYDLDGNQTEIQEQTATGWATTDTRYNAEGQVWDVLAPTVEGGRPETVTLYDLDGERCDTQASQIRRGADGMGATDVTFDADGNAYETQSPPNDLGQRPTSYSFYDGDGNVCFSQTQAEFATGTFTQYSYDSLGEQTEVVGPAVNGAARRPDRLRQRGKCRRQRRLQARLGCGKPLDKPPPRPTIMKATRLRTGRGRRRQDHHLHLRRGGRRADRDRPRLGCHHEHLRHLRRPLVARRGRRDHHARLRRLRRPDRHNRPRRRRDHR